MDGLRALSVLAVIIYHANLNVFGFSLFSGGYLGVDVFFVLSGYLITKILVASIYNGDFSFASFYIARIKRIVPALFFVLLVSAIAAYYVLLPQEFELYAESLKSSLLFTLTCILVLKTHMMQLRVYINRCFILGVCL